MTVRNYLFLVVVALVLGISFSLYYTTLQEARQEYDFSILKIRTEKDLFMATSPESPFGTENDFGSLSYFSPNPDFRTEAKLTLIADSIPRYMAMTKSKSSRFVRQGYVDFKLNGLTCRLYVYLQPTDEKFPQHLFIPFTDLTNGTETYQGGRYLDVKLPEKGVTEMQLDFNLAYNPYCVYNPEYNCPVPPSKNHLNIRVEAGEKRYKPKK